MKMGKSVWKLKSSSFFLLVHSYQKYIEFMRLYVNDKSENVKINKNQMRDDCKKS